MANKVEIYTRFDPPPAPVLDFSQAPVLVAREFAQEADINFLLARYKKTGSMYTVEEMVRSRRRPQFGDFTGIPDYHDSCSKFAQALEMFDELPLAVRQRFHDSPVELLKFLQDKDNLDEAVKLGLVEKPVEPNSKSSETSEPVHETQPATTQEEQAK